MFKWLDYFRKGQMVANPEMWKKRQITVVILTPLILGSCSLLKMVTGYEIPIDETLANQISLTIISIASIVLTITTSEKVGILPAKPTTPNDSGQPPSPSATDSAKKLFGG